MYNLNQSYGMGYLNYMDWKSVELAGVGSKQLKQTIIDTAVAMGKLKKNEVDIGSFASSLKKKWADTEVMEAAFGKFATAMEEAYRLVEAGEFDTASEALESLNGKWDELSLTASTAAQSAKTFNEAILATKDAVSSKWMKSFEIIFGNYEEAKKLWTGLANELYDIFAESGNARNEMLQSWKDLGGRDDLIQSFKNIYQAIRAIVDPIKNAFRDIFPKMTAERLFNLTKGLKEFTEKLIISDEKAQKLKEAFTGFFKIVKSGIGIVGQIVSAFGRLLGHFSSLGGGLLSLGSLFGRYLGRLADTINNSEIFKNVLEGIVTAIDKLLSNLGYLAKKYINFEGIVRFFQGIFNFVKKIAAVIVKVMGELFRNGDVKMALDTLNSGLVGAGLFGIARFMNNVADASKNIKGTFKGVSNILKEVGNVLEAWQKSIKANVIMKIAKAIALMAASLFLLAMVNPERMTSALGGLTGAISEMMVSLWLFFKIFPKDASQTKGMWKALTAMISISFAMLMFAGTLKTLGKMSWDEIGRGLTAMGGALAELLATIFILKSMNTKDIKKSISAINSLTFSLFIASLSLKVLSTMSWGEIGRGLTAMGGALVELVLATRFLPKIDKGTKVKGLFGTVMSLLVLAGVLKILATMSWGDILKSLVAMGVALAELVITLNLLPKTSKGNKVKGLFSTVLSMVILAGALKILATMSWDDIARSLVAIGGALAELLVATILISKFAGKGSGATLLAISASLILLATGLKILSMVDFESALWGIASLAIALAVLGGASFLLGKILPEILGVAGAMALFSLAVVGFGVGLMLISAGIASLAASLAGGATVIVAGISAIILGILQLIPDIMKGVAQIIKGLLVAIKECVPLIAETIVTVIYEVLKTLGTYMPQIVEALGQLIVNLLDSLTEWVPQIVESAIKLVDTVFHAIINAISVLDPSVIMQGVVCIGLLTLIMIGLAHLSSMIPAAAVGIIALGALTVELAAVLAVIGKLSQIPGLKEAVGEGGNLLQAVGMAIGKFIGSIVGGIAAGATAALPEIGYNLSEFMYTIKGFINGVKDVPNDVLGKIALLSGAMVLLSEAGFISQILELITIGSSLEDLGNSLSQFMINMSPFLYIAESIDPSILDGVTALSKAILILSASNLIDSLSGLISWATGGHSLSDFGSEIAELGSHLRKFTDNLGNFDDKKVKMVSCAGEAIVKLAEAANRIPNEGGLVALLAGDNSIAQFGDELPGLGKHLKKFVESLGSFSDQQVNTVEAAGNAILKLAESANKIPAKGGLWESLAGDNSLATFGEDLPPLAKHLNEFITNLGSFGEEQLNTVDAAGNAIVKLAEAASKIPNEGGLWSKLAGDNSLSQFSSYLPPLGKDISNFISNLGGFGDEQLKTVNAAGEAIVKLAEAASKIPNEGGLWAKLAGDNSLAKFSSYLPGLGSDITKFITNLGSFSDDQVATVECAGNAIVKLADAASKIPNEGGLWAKLAGDNSIADFGKKLPDVGVNLKKFVESLGTFGDDQIKTVDAGGRAIKALAEAANQVPNTGGLVSWFEGDNDISEFASKFPDVGANLSGFARNLGTFSDEQVKTVDAGGRAIKALAEAANQVPNTGGLKQWFTGESNIKDFSYAFWDVGSGLNAFIRAIGTFGDKELETVKYATEALKDMVSLAQVAHWSDNAPEKLKNMTYIFWDVGAGINAFVRAQQDISIDDVKQAAEKLREIVNSVELIKNLNADNLDNFKNCLKQIADDGVKAFYESIDNDESLNKSREAAKIFIKAFTDAAESVKIEVKTKFIEVATEAYNGLNDDKILKGAYNLGYNLVKGFANGITGGKQLARDAGSAVGREALDAAKKAIDAHSPSREAEKIGNFFDLGFVRGINDFASKVYDSSFNVGNKAKDGLSNAIYKISDMIDNDMDSSPVIRPILDLDDIDSGISSINSMFGNPSLSLASNLGAISTGMRYTNQNRNSDIVSAIDKLRNNISNSNGDTYNINGITYDDGSEISEAVKTLVRAARIERRV